MIYLAIEQQTINGQELFMQAVAAGLAALKDVMSQRLTYLLILAVTRLLGRGHHVRRGQVPVWQELDGYCQRCGSRQSRQFSRNGYRMRRLGTPWVDLVIPLPRLRCQCGGSVRITYADWLCPYQRFVHEVDTLIQRWGSLALSVRQIQKELAHAHIPISGLRTIVKRLHQLQELKPQADPKQVPPVMQVDAIWFKQLRPNGRYRTDRKGRRRPVKGVFRRCLLIAMGVWPDTGRREVLSFALADGESEAAWTTFLSQLEAQGIRADHGLELIIHDGGSGLQAALQTVHFGARQQRCIFHKLRNIARAIQLPEDLSPSQRRRRKKAILKDFIAIWQAQRYATTLRRYLAVVRKYRSAQPQAVATLRRDFRASLTYFTLLARHPHWPREHLRTISHLERFNRKLRRQIRAAGAYHSDAGILAMVAQETSLWNNVQVKHKISTT